MTEDDYSRHISPSGEAPCMICGKPSASRKHREECLSKSEDKIYKELKKNKKKQDKLDKKERQP